MLKSSFDTVAAAVTLVLYAPFLLVIALAIRLESSGPVFFRQYRIGRNGRQFVMLKFRTMMPCAAGSQFVDTIKPSVTRVGRLLRRYSLDELPQLINVARGDMSLVGP
ncbi:MAG: sugar transferase, partial [Actinobacteria bacterium]|nr:sugar transferase [Actinomycetota bacterium]